MDYISRYIKRLDNRGSDPTNAAINTSKRLQNDKFNTSPSFSVVLVNGHFTDSIVNNETKYDEKMISFRPDTAVDIGSIVEYKVKTYLLISFIDNEIYPKGKLKLCNETFPLTGDLVCREVGRDFLNRPILECTPSSQKSLPCIVENSYYIEKYDNAINLPENQLRVTIPYTVHKDIEINKEFSMYGEMYKIIGIDRTQSIGGIGLMTIICRRGVTE
ncbi:hypothetical protein [Metabacillus fastidiosus]|uniref:hypothetical protein n=1 Tax=Metabacillus fastidiosus TaxID=1458 RepID=UPI003D2E0E15